MKRGFSEIIFILDRSASMVGLEKDTIGSFNNTIEKQKKEPGTAKVSTVLFDSDTEVLHDRIDISQIEAMTEKQYYVRGATALGGTIHHIGNVHKYAREEDRFHHHYRRRRKRQLSLLGRQSPSNGKTSKKRNTVGNFSSSVQTSMLSRRRGSTAFQKTALRIFVMINAELKSAVGCRWKCFTVFAMTNSSRTIGMSNSKKTCAVGVVKIRKGIIASRYC